MVMTNLEEQNHQLKAEIEHLQLSAEKARLEQDLAFHELLKNAGSNRHTIISLLIGVLTALVASLIAFHTI